MHQGHRREQQRICYHALGLVGKRRHVVHPEPPRGDADRDGGAEQDNEESGGGVAGLDEPEPGQGEPEDAVECLPSSGRPGRGYRVLPTVAMAWTDTFQPRKDIRS